jgi:subtilisin family serine protease
MFSSLWGLTNSRGLAAERGWLVSTGSSDVVVAVLDTGIDYTHPDLQANMWVNPGEVPANGIDDDSNGYVDDVHGINASFRATNRSDPMDDNGHGTHVAGTIGAVGGNGQGIVGVNQRVKLLGLKFLSASGSGSLSDAITAIEYMIQLKNRGVNIRVANNSWGGSGYSAALEEAIERARNAGIIFVAAAGNDGADNDLEPSYPANFELENVVSVAAIDEDGNLASFSNYGASMVDIAAPGVGIYSTFPGNRYARLSGTSMATPHVVGAVALLLASEPGLTMTQVIERLYGAGKDRSSLFDGGRGIPIVRTQRSVDVGRMVFNETAPIPSGNSANPTCSYELTTANLVAGATIDTAADGQPIIQQSDEGEFYQLDLPFSFPFYTTSVSSVFISPNGVVYLNPPEGIDFQPGRTAPLQSIAALHTDLVPLSKTHGVRVFKNSERATIFWEQGLFSARDLSGSVEVRLTLHASGKIETSVSFGQGTEALAMQRLVLGDPFQSPATPPSALDRPAIPISAEASTLNISDALRSMSSSSDSPVVLGVSMQPKCDRSSPVPVVNSISLHKRLSARQTAPVTPVRGVLQGQGSGQVPLVLTVDSFQCSGVKKVTLEQGQARFRVRVPRGPSRLEVSSGSARGSLKLPSRSTTKSRGRARRAGTSLCKAILRTIRLG